MYKGVGKPIGPVASNLFHYFSRGVQGLLWQLPRDGTGRASVPQQGAFRASGIVSRSVCEWGAGGGASAVQLAHAAVWRWVACRMCGGARFGVAQDLGTHGLKRGIMS